METIEVRTEVRVEPRTAFEFLLDFTNYADFSPYVRDVTIETPGKSIAGVSRGIGTIYDVTFGWWRLSYRIQTEVTDVRPPERIGWRVASDLDARGRWEVEPVQSEDGDATTVRFVVTYDSGGSEPNDFDRPSFISFDWIVDAVIPIIEKEGRRVVDRVVTALEGESRPVDLVVEKRSGPIDRPSE
ncbi:MAG: SRPBCC family protein [Halodesulfurarchaeum sp.]